GCFITHNRAFREMWDLPEELLACGQDAAAVRHVLAKVRDPEGFEAGVEETYRDPGSESHHVIELLDGRIIERYSRPQRLGGEVVGRGWSCRDVTERVRAEEAIREAHAELENRVAARTAELGDAVHALQAEIGER